MKKHTLFVFFVISMLLATSCAPTFKPAEYASVTGSATAGTETQISLDDGASISIPENSIEGDVSVKIERNPEKAKTLPPLPKGFTQVSDFYNFEVASGKLAGAVDLTLPFNEKLIPSGKGILMFLIPTADGWEAQPVENNGNKATIFTEDLGDPLFAWNFTEPDQLHICDGGSISVSAVPTGEQDKYEIVGRVTKKKNLLELMSGVILGDLSVDIEAKSLFGTTTRNFSVLTKSDGTFSVTLDLSEIPEKNLSVASSIRIAAIVQCKPKIMTPDTYIAKIAAYDSFYIYPATVEQPVTPAPTQPPAADSAPIAPPKSPTDKIPVPNVVGMDFDAAQKTLEDLGFNTTWIDGKSSLELGKIYSQAPAAGTLSVPHRTTVVVYRTTEVVAAIPTCADLNLTPEEMANCDTHEYQEKSCVAELVSGDPGVNQFSCSPPSNREQNFFWLFAGLKKDYKKTGTNTYTTDWSTKTDSQGWIWKSQITIVFNSNGYEMTVLHVDHAGGAYPLDYTWRMIQEMIIVK